MCSSADLRNLLKSFIFFSSPVHSISNHFSSRAYYTLKVAVVMSGIRRKFHLSLVISQMLFKLHQGISGSCILGNGQFDERF